MKHRDINKNTTITEKTYRNLVIGIFIGAIIAIGAFLILTPSLVNDNSTEINKLQQDINMYKYNGSIMYNHLAICFVATQCLNDIKSCQDINKINIIGPQCLNVDQNILKLYDVFKRL